MSNKKISLKRKILAKIVGVYPDWYPSYKVEKLAMEEGFMSSNATRRARELAETSIIEKRLNGKTVEYRYVPPEPRTLGFEEQRERIQ